MRDHLQERVFEGTHSVRAGIAWRDEWRELMLRPVAHLWGRWRITEMELWTAEDLDLLGPARLTLDRDDSGEMSFVAVEVGLDYRVGLRDGQPAVEFTFDGSDEGDGISGRGWAVLEQDALHGRIFIHHGDDSSFVARRDANVAAWPRPPTLLATSCNLPRP